MLPVHTADRHDGLHDDLVRYSKYLILRNRKGKLNKCSASLAIPRLLEIEHGSNPERPHTPKLR
jgi:hypothetical protein